MPHPNLAHVNQTTRELLTDVELNHKNMREVLCTQCLTEAEGTDRPKLGLAKLVGVSVTLQKD